MQFDLGTLVHTDDGKQVGKVDRVILRDAGGAVLGIVVHKGFFFMRDVLVPVGQVSGVDAAGVHLQLSGDQVDSLPDFIEDEYAAPPTTWEPPSTYLMGGVMFPLGMEPGVAPMLVAEHKHLAPGSSDIARGYSVICTDGEAGLVKGIVIDSALQRIDHLVLESGEDGLDDLEVPASSILGIDNETINLNCTLAELRVAGRRSS